MALSRMGALVESLRELKMEGREVMLVSSGAVGLGRVQLGLTKEQVSNPENFIDKQACAAAGQEMLMSMYHMMFNRMGVRASQVLITQADLLERHRYMFLTDTLDKLTQLGTIPIINENDVVTGGSKGPQVFEDNDNLSAILASGAAADGLALLTDVEAVFTKPPNEPGAQRIKVCTFSKVVSILVFYGKSTGALTFENLFRCGMSRARSSWAKSPVCICVYACVDVWVGHGTQGHRQQD
jgi:glutamate 5-kinase